MTDLDPVTPAPLRRWRRRLLLGVGGLLGLGALGLALVTGATRGAPRRSVSVGPPAGPALRPLAPDQPLRVVSWNLAHGRGLAFHQAGLERAELEANLRGVAQVLRREAPHLVALQEADGPSRWSGRFDHVELLRAEAGLARAARAAHVEGLGLSYGTALLSALPCGAAEQVTFAPSPPTLTKGFLRLRVQAWEDLELEVFSIHLDFSRESVRRAQLAALAAELPRDRPALLLGDFNCGWETLGPWAAAHGLRGWEAGRARVTFPGLGRRLDWILASAELELQREEVLPERWSDHLAVVASVARVGSATQGK